jgi:hypothetical protein
MIDVAHDFIDIDHHAKVSGVYDGWPFFLASYFLGLLLSLKSRGMSLCAIQFFLSFLVVLISSHAFLEDGPDLQIT